MEGFASLTGKVAGFLWGTPMLLLLGGTAVYLTIGLRGIQFRKTLHGFALLFKGSDDDEGDISPFQALTTALAATVGTGNIAGVATAIVAGGPGALFWMWVMGLLGMATKFSEIFLSLKFRKVGDDGKMMGGPMYYIEHGFGSKTLATVFAFCCLAGSLGPGNLVQSHSISIAVKDLFGIAPIFSGIFFAVLVAVVILGGIERIGNVSAKLVPAMAGLYVLGGLGIILLNISALPSALLLIIESAFSPTSAMGGFAGASVKSAIQMGFARGTFSNESGLGSAPIAHAAAKTNNPARQALIGMIGVCIDTLIICSITGIAIVITGVWQSGANGAELTISAFNAGLPGDSSGGMIVSIGLILFAFSTFIGWSFYGLQCVEYLWGLKVALAYRWVFVLIIPLGPLLKIDVVWNIVDILVAIMVIPNVISLLGLSKMIFKEAKADGLHR